MFPNGKNKLRHNFIWTHIKNSLRRILQAVGYGILIRALPHKPQQKQSFPCSHSSSFLTFISTLLLLPQPSSPNRQPPCPPLLALQSPLTTWYLTQAKPRTTSLPATTTSTRRVLTNIGKATMDSRPKFSNFQEFGSGCTLSSGTKAVDCWKGSSTMN